LKSQKFLAAIHLMDSKRLDLNLLTPEALLAEQNVTKAASGLHLSQPAVSAQLGLLRDEFYDPPLIPAQRGMTPTANGCGRWRRPPSQVARADTPLTLVRTTPRGASRSRPRPRLARRRLRARLDRGYLA
jgi:regulatory helix-turn-helix LysR family protein